MPKLKLKLDNILEAIRDPEVWEPLFKNKSWDAWRAFLGYLYALPLSDDEMRVVKRQAGRQDQPISAFKRAMVVAGRRSGKSRVAALVAAWTAIQDYSRVLAAGETGVVMVLASDRAQARNIFNYVRAFLSVPALKDMVLREGQESLELQNSVRVEIHTSSFRAVRGYTIVAAILDELAYWPTDDAANPDSEVVAALEPAMATIPNALLLGVSSPYAKRGVLWEEYREHHGVEGSDTLVWRAASREMNPTLSRFTVAAAYIRDAAAAQAEFGGQFRDDIENFISAEVVDSVTEFGRHELPFLSGNTYVCFVDPSGGRSDSMTLAIAHQEKETCILDAVREVVPPFSPESVVSEFAQLLRNYHISEVSGDRYAGEWPREQFQKHGMTYKPSERTKSELYLELLPRLNSGQVRLLDHQKLRAQLASLTRRTARGGRDSIDHPPGSHDDLANAAAGALVMTRADLGLGLVEWLKAGAPETTNVPNPFNDRGRMLEIEAKMAGIKSAVGMPGSLKPPSDVVCDNCSSTCVQTIPGGQQRCQQCGTQWYRGERPKVVYSGFGAGGRPTLKER